LTTLKMAVFAPIASARINTAADVNRQSRRSLRAASRVSLKSLSNRIVRNTIALRFH